MASPLMEEEAAQMKESSGLAAVSPYPLVPPATRGADGEAAAAMGEGEREADGAEVGAAHEASAKRAVAATAKGTNPDLIIASLRWCFGQMSGRGGTVAQRTQLGISGGKPDLSVAPLPTF